MSNYPPQSPWGPHGPQVDVPSTTPNPTIPTPMPDPTSPTAYPASTGYGTSTGYSGGGGSGGGGMPGIPAMAVGTWVRNFAIGGVVLGGLVGFARGAALHVPSAMMGGLVLRFAFAGAAAGAGIPPAIKAFSLAVRAIGWVVLAAVLWWIAGYLMGGAGWLSRLR